MERLLVTIPPAIPMVALLGAGDANILAIEAAFPSVNITVRGNEITPINELKPSAGGYISRQVAFNPAVSENWCAYCDSFVESKNRKCPNCGAPL